MIYTYEILRQPINLTVIYHATTTGLVSEEKEQTKNKK